MKNFLANNILFRLIRKKFIKNNSDRDDYRNIFRISLPSFVELFLSSSLGAVGTMMVGSLGKEAISGVGLTNQPFFLLIAIFSAVNVGTTTIVSWNIGAGNKEKASVVALNALLLNMVLGILLCGVGLLVATPVMHFMTPSEQTRAYAIEYFNIICIGVPFTAIAMCVSSIFRGTGQTRIPMMYNVIANIINVIFNYLLINGVWFFSKLGVAGSAYATTISRIISAVLAVLFLLYLRQNTIKIYIRRFKADIKCLLDIMTIGIPSALEQFVIQSGLMIFAKIIAEIGDAQFAAHTIVANVNGMTFSISQAFSISTTTLVGQAVGADNYEKAEDITRKTRVMARVTTAFIAVIFIVFGAQMAWLFNKEAVVINLAAPVFIIAAMIQFIQSTQMSTAGALRGSGDTMYPLYASILGIWGFRITVSLLFVRVFDWNLLGAWGAFFIDQLGRSYIIHRRFNSGKWKNMKAIVEAKNQRRRERFSKL